MIASCTRQTMSTKIITHTPTQQLPTPYNHLNRKFTTFCLHHNFFVKLKAKKVHQNSISYEPIITYNLRYP